MTALPSITARLALWVIVAEMAMAAAGIALGMLPVAGLVEPERAVLVEPVLRLLQTVALALAGGGSAGVAVYGLRHWGTPRAPTSMELLSRSAVGDGDVGGE